MREDPVLHDHTSERAVGGYTTLRVQSAGLTFSCLLQYLRTAERQPAIVDESPSVDADYVGNGS